MLGNDCAEDKICVRIVDQAVSSTFRAVQAITRLYCFFYALFKDTSAALEDEDDLAAVLMRMDAYRCTGDQLRSGQDPVRSVEVHTGFKMFIAAFEILEVRDLYVMFLYYHNDVF